MARGAQNPGFMKNIKIEVEIPAERLDNYIRRADIAHWGEMKTWKPQKLELDLVVENDEVPADQRKIRVGIAELQRGLAAMASRLPRHFLDFVTDEGDGYTGNILVQLAAFGEIRFE